MKPTPPRLFTEVLVRSVGRQHNPDEVAGDLHEEFVAIAFSRGLRTARRWYAVQTVRLTGRALFGRAAGLWRPAATGHHEQNPGDSLMRSLVTDTRHAVRTLAKRPALSSLVVLTLALGLGANAAIFQVIDALILRPFTIPQLERLVMISETGLDMQGESQETVSPANYLDFKKQADVFDRLAAFEWWDVNLAGADEAERVPGFYVTADFFPALGVEAALGRTFTPDEETYGGHHRVVLGHDLWQRRFGGDRDIVGKTVLLDVKPFEVIGVAPAGFAFPLGSTLWGALAFDAKTAARRDARYLTLVGRLADGRTVEDAKAQIALIAQRLEQQYPETNKDRGAKVLTLVQGMRDQGLGSIVALWQAAAGFVLLIACANIANLLLARGAERQREIAVRSALGASRRRIVREMLVESAVLAAAAVPVALAVAWAGITIIRANLPPRLLRFVVGWQTMDVDPRLIVFTALLAGITAVVFGWLPAIRASRPMLADALKEGGRSATVGRQRQRMRSALVVAEIALALPLLVASGLSTIGAHKFLKGSQGYEPDGLLVMRTVLPDAKYAAPEARIRFITDLEQRLASLPGVRSVGISNVLPATGNNAGGPIEIEGIPVADKANPPRVDSRAVAPALFETMQIPILRGRGFTHSDRADSQPVAIISQAAAERHFGSRDPIGRRIKVGQSPWLTIVGVSGDVIQDWFSRRNFPTAFRPYPQAPTSYLAIAVRAEGDLPSLIPPVRAAFREVDAAQPVFDIMPMRVALQERTIGLQYVAGIMTVFGALALGLAVVGVYSVMAFVITQRTHEIGVRIALGANRRDVLRLTVGQAASMTAIGIVVGLALSFGLGRLMEAALFGVISNDIRVAGGFAAVLIAAAITAGYIPARRATGIDPIIALRTD
jgi:putative ABC transport system permease protein